MGVRKWVSLRGRGVIKGMLLAGFGVQTALGLLWLCCNLGGVQDFPEPESALYQGVSGLFGKVPFLLYLMQRAAAGGAGYRFLSRFLWAAGSAGRKAGQAALWGSLALLAYPFALQCHLAVLPSSFQGSLFLLMLSFLLELLFLRKWSRPGNFPEAFSHPGERAAGQFLRCSLWAPLRRWSAGKRTLCSAAGALCCLSLMVLLYGPEGLFYGMNVPGTSPEGTVYSEGGDGQEEAGGSSGAGGAADMEQVSEGGVPGKEGRNGSRRSPESVLADRVAWPTLWQDHDRWTEYLPGVPDSVWWEASYCPGNLAVLQAAVEEALEEDAARALYREMTEYAWQVHWPMVVRQIGWDVLGYAVTPLVFQLQLQGEAYDSFTGRNYEVMRGQAPRLTRLYVDYGCWWYGAGLALGLCLMVVEFLAGKNRGWRRAAAALAVCALAAGIQTALFALRGAGVMDYKCTIAVSQLWPGMVLLLMGREQVHGERGAGMWP